MDLSGLKWPAIIVVIVGLGWLFTSGGVNWMYGNLTAASPGIDEQQDLRDEAGLTSLAGYTYHIWKWRATIDIIETSVERYGEWGPNYYFNLERLSTCYERIGDQQTSYNILRDLMDANAHEIDSRVGNNDNLSMRAAKLREMYELQ
ncbi:MAG: hypothetical protein L3K26_06380 [Candidatus Hydrogenedentes bacterium]|nr:hypothetical protein [Candidatus Hydrogenedentota bacterium]